MIAEQQTIIIGLLNGKDSGEITADEYEKQSRLVQNKIDELNLQKESAIAEQSKMQLSEYRADAIAELLNGGTILNEFDADIFKSPVKQIRVIVYGRNKQRNKKSDNYFGK